jgi:type II secretory pathway pseudopilin PulG
MVLIGLLAGLGLPRYRTIKRRAVAAAAIGDFSSIRVAAYNYFAEHGTFPPDSPAGIAPPGLVPHLPSGFEFTNGHYTLDYDQWPADPMNPAQVVLGVTVTAGDQEIIHLIARTVKSGSVGLVTGDAYTYILAGL